MGRRIRSGLCLSVLALALALATPSTGSTAGSAPADDFRLLQTRTSLLGTHAWFQQTHRGIDVLGGVLGRHQYDDGRLRVDDLRMPIRTPVDVTPTLSPGQAKRLVGDASNARLVIDPRSSRLVYAVTSVVGHGATRTLVDADSGAVLGRISVSRHDDGTGRVFEPNPVVTLQDPTLEDSGDADLPAFAAAYRDVVLTHLDGTGFLRGDYAAIGFDDSETAFSPGLDFSYPRSSTHFSQVMAYHHLTRAQEYIQALGFTGARSILARPQVVYPDAFEFDQSFFVPDTGEIFFGAGGVDDAEDADIIWHEYGHAIQNDQIPFFGVGDDARAIGEGFSDFWAVTMSQPVNGGYDEPCLGDWDAFPSRDGSPRCLIRVDTDTTVEDRVGEEHQDGRIWSRALWDVNQALGRDATARLVLESQFAFSPDVTFGQAAAITIDTARLLLGSAAARIVERAFADRGILGSGPAAGVDARATPAAGPGLHEVARLDVEAPGGGIMFGVLEAYDLNNAGEALFATDLTTGGQGLFLSRRGTLRELAVTGDPAPGGGFFGLGPLARAVLNNRSEAAFSFFPEMFAQPYPVDLSLYRWSFGAGVQPVVVPGVTAAPTGGTFHGTSDVYLSDSGDIAFAGLVDSDHGTHPELGLGLFLSRRNGGIQPLVVPGDPVPGLGVLDFADSPSINLAGDLAFGGHLAGRPCVSSVPQTSTVGCERDLFVRTEGVVERVVAAGDPAPGGGTFRRITYPVINESGDVVFRASVNDGGVLEGGVFLLRGGHVEALVRHQDAMPDGGNVRAVAAFPVNWDINDRGEVTFAVALDTDDNDDGLPDHGLYLWADGKLSVVVRSGQTVPGDAQLLVLQPDAFVGTLAPVTGAQLNDSRQVLLTAFVAGPSTFGTVLYLAGLAGGT